PFSGTVATFTDAGYATNIAGDFTASIDWGDGTITPGTVTGGAGTFTVSGNHTYADEGSFNVTVVLSEDIASAASATANSTAIVSEGDTLSAVSAYAAVSRAPCSAAVATSTGAGYATNVAGDFTATIDWGDGTTGPGIVSGSAGSFTVSGNHTYADEGTL